MSVCQNCQQPNCCCEACPPCNPALDETCEAFEITTTAKRLIVEDEAACKRTIEQPSETSISYFDGENIVWADGSTTKPICLSIKTLNDGDVPYLVTVDDNGCLQLWRPTPSSTPTFPVSTDGVIEWQEFTALIQDGTITAAMLATTLDLSSKTLTFPTKFALGDWTLKTGIYTAVNGDRLNANTSAGSFDITLPLTPANGDQVYIFDHDDTWSANNLGVLRNGSLINGIADDLLCNTGARMLLFIYWGDTTGWRVVTLS